MRRLALSLLLLCLAAAHSSAAGPQRNSVVFFQRWSAPFDDSALQVIAEATQWA